VKFEYVTSHVRDRSGLSALEDFFRVLDETAQDSHWKYRKAFWSAYLRRDVIVDAWATSARSTSRPIGW
jgi:hypothetical protein